MTIEVLSIFLALNAQKLVAYVILWNNHDHERSIFPFLVSNSLRLYKIINQSLMFGAPFNQTKTDYQIRNVVTDLSASMTENSQKKRTKQKEKQNQMKLKHLDSQSLLPPDSSRCFFNNAAA